MRHVKKLAEQLATMGAPGRSLGDPFLIINALVDELEALDGREFNPDDRARFSIARAQGRRFAKANSIGDTGAIARWAATVAGLMDAYGTQRLTAVRPFTWLSDVALREIIQRDFLELKATLIPHGAWKSAVIMAGSILEAILTDLLTKDPTRLAAARASAAAPKQKNGVATSESGWTLANLIAIAAELALITQERSNTFDQVLRDYRNFVHPSKELRSKHMCGEEEAYMAFGALGAICNHLDRKFPLPSETVITVISNPRSVMTTLLVSFDLEEVSTADYDNAYDALAKIGLFRCSPRKDLRLPDSTVLGDVAFDGGAATARDVLDDTLAKATRKRVSRLAVAIVSDWAVNGNADPVTSLKELSAYLGL